MANNPFLSMLPSLIPYTNPVDISIKNRALQQEDEKINIQENIERKKLEQFEVLERARQEIERTKNRDDLMMSQKRLQQQDYEYEQNPVLREFNAGEKLAKGHAERVNLLYQQAMAIASKFGIGTKYGKVQNPTIDDVKSSVKTMIDNPNLASKEMFGGVRAIDNIFKQIKSINQTIAGANSFSQYAFGQNVNPDWNNFVPQVVDRMKNEQLLLQLLQAILGIKDEKTGKVTEVDEIFKKIITGQEKE